MGGDPFTYIQITYYKTYPDTLTRAMIDPSTEYTAWYGSTHHSYFASPG